MTCKHNKDGFCQYKRVSGGCRLLMMACGDETVIVSFSKYLEHAKKEVSKKYE